MRHWRTSTLVVLLTVLAFTRWSPSPIRAQLQPVGADILITPGVGIARGRLGMNLSQVVAIWGGPKSSHRWASGRTQYRWYACPNERCSADGGGLSVFIDDADEVVKVRVFANSRYRTEHLIRTGVPEYTVNSGFHGSSDRPEVETDSGGTWYRYPNDGIAFHVNDNESEAYYQEIDAIDVFAK